MERFLNDSQGTKENDSFQILAFIEHPNGYMSSVPYSSIANFLGISERLLFRWMALPEFIPRQKELHNMLDVLDQVYSIKEVIDG